MDQHPPLRVVETTPVRAGDTAAFPAEQAVLGMLMNNNAILAAIPQLAEKHFADEAHGRIFAAIQNRVAAGRTADAVTLIPEFDDDPGLLQVGGGSYLARLGGEAVVPGRVIPDYAATIIECWKLRVLRELSRQMSEARDSSIAAGLMDELRNLDSAGQSDIVASDISVQDLEDFRDHGKDGIFSTGFRGLDDYMKIRLGDMSVVTGMPGSGKSEFVDAVMMNLATAHGHRFVVCSFENQPPALHLSKLAEKHLGLPFWDGPTPRMQTHELERALAWLREHFDIIAFSDEEPATLDRILDAARDVRRRKGAHGLVIDPWNWLDHLRAPDQTETDYISQCLTRVKRFAVSQQCHVWIVAHPAKAFVVNGAKTIPGLYDISGSAHWVNKADVGITVHREDPKQTKVDIHVKKVRHKFVGKVGTVSLDYDRRTGRYSDMGYYGS